MSTTTTTLGLTKPDGDEKYDIGVFNTNFDIIDAKMNISLRRLIVDELPTIDISTSTIYLVLQETIGTVYNEYLFIEGAWSLVGTTATNNPAEAAALGFDDTETEFNASNVQEAIVNLEFNTNLKVNDINDDIAKRRGVKVTLTTAGWVTSNTYAKYSHKQTISVSDMTAIDGVPIECVPYPAAGIKTEAEATAYGLVKEAYGDSTAKKIYFYATSLPVTAIAYSVKEVVL